jgi:hypothetical protein
MKEGDTAIDEIFRRHYHMRSVISFIIFAMVAAMLICVRVSAQEDDAALKPVTEKLNDQIRQLEDEVSMLKIQIANQQQQAHSHNTGYASLGIVLFLCGAFCALWAQDSGRRPWFWFVMGFILPLLTVIALLIRNAEDIRREQ